MNTEKKLTAMQELISKLNPNFFTEEEANYYLEKEKQQIIDAVINTSSLGENLAEVFANGYFNQTFKNE